MAVLPEKQNYISHILCVPLAMQAQSSGFIILSLISVQKLKLWIPQTTEIGAMKFCSNFTPKGLFVLTFCPLGLSFS